MAVQLERIDHIHVFVRDRSFSEQWYARVLQLARVPELAFWADEGGPLTIANAEGTIHLALFEQPVQAQTCGATVAFAVSAAHFIAWRDHLARELERPPAIEDHTVSWSLYFSDPDGNPFEITSYDYDELSRRLRAD